MLNHSVCRKCIAKGLCQDNYQGPTNMSVLPVGESRMGVALSPL